MPGKHYSKLGKTKLVRVPQSLHEWIQKVARELDTKDNPEETMDIFLALLEKTR